MALDVLLIGKTGVGKSSTGNSILGFRAFGSSFEHTTKLQSASMRLPDGRALRVVESLGVGDYRQSKEYGKNHDLKVIKEAAVMSPHGYHALLIVYKFGYRPTKEDLDTIKYLKEVFGENFIKKYGIAIMTTGDDFKHQQEDGEIDLSFEDWCKDQGGFYRDIFPELGWRIILFDNRCRDKTEQDLQRQKLVDMIYDIHVGGSRCVIEQYVKTQIEREKSKDDYRMKIIIQEINGRMRLLEREFCRLTNIEDSDQQIAGMESIKVQIKEQFDRIDKEQNSSPQMNNIYRALLRFESRVSNEVTRLNLKKEFEEWKKKPREDDLVLEKKGGESTWEILEARHAMTEARDENIASKMLEVVATQFNYASSFFETKN